MDFLKSFIAFLSHLLIPEAPTEPPEAPVKPPEPLPDPITPMDPYLTTLLPWTSQKNNYHNVGVIADSVGLTPAQKLVLRACIYQESEFLINPKPNQNIDPKTGQVWSTDYGIVQINDHFHIGPGKDFPSVAYVIGHPEECVRWMAKILKNTGALKPWSSFSTGAYLEWMKPGSPMFKLV